MILIKEQVKMCFSYKLCRNSWNSHMLKKENNFKLHFISDTKMNTKYITDIKVKAMTIKFSRRKFSWLGVIDCLATTPKVQPRKVKPQLTRPSELEMSALKKKMLWGGFVIGWLNPPPAMLASHIGASSRSDCFTSNPAMHLQKQPRWSKYLGPWQPMQEI